MKRKILPLLGLLGAALLPAAHHEEAGRQYLELQTYQARTAADAALLDKYLESAFVPALKRQGLAPVGVFSEMEPEGAPRYFVLISYESLAQFAGVQEKLDADAAYNKAAAEYFAAPRKEPRFTRMQSELLHAFEAFPQVHVPGQKKKGKDRLFELRTYESHTEDMGRLKVEMFNAGEVPIFLDAGIQPVFMGRALVGPHRPNLTYMTVFDDMPALEKAWAAFREHPDWKKLSGVEKYKGSVSKIHKTWLKPRPYSGL